MLVWRPRIANAESEHSASEPFEFDCDNFRKTGTAVVETHSDADVESRSIVFYVRRRIRSSKLRPLHLRVEFRQYELMSLDVTNESMFCLYGSPWGYAQ